MGDDGEIQHSDGPGRERRRQGRGHQLARHLHVRRNSDSFQHYPIPEVRMGTGTEIGQKKFPGCLTRSLRPEATLATISVQRVAPDHTW